jgi:hypothetical protein
MKLYILRFHISTSSSRVWYTGVADHTKNPPGRRTRFNSKSNKPPIMEKEVLIQLNDNVKFYKKKKEKML